MVPNFWPPNYRWPDITRLSDRPRAGLRRPGGSMPHSADGCSALDARRPLVILYRILYTGYGVPKLVAFAIAAGCSSPGRGRGIIAEHRPGQDVHLCTGPLYHSVINNMSLHGPLTTGAAVVIMPRFDIEQGPGADRAAPGHAYAHGADDVAPAAATAGTALAVLLAEQPLVDLSVVLPGQLGGEVHRLRALVVGKPVLGHDFGRPSP